MLRTLLTFILVCWAMLAQAMLAQASHYLKPATDKCSLPPEKQPLEQILPCYVQQPDDSFGYRLEDSYELSEKKLRVYSLRLFSQRWEPGEAGSVDHGIWEHRVTVYVPETVKKSTALLYINGGTLYPEPKPSEPNPSEPNRKEVDFASIAFETGTVVIDLNDIPNQSLTFPDSEPLAEDHLIAYTWKKFLKDPVQNRHWPLRLPMVKSAVRTMDMVQAFMKKKNIELNEFVVSGGSKRGWTAWLTSAMDSRVTMVVPMVIDILNLRANMKHHENAYGFWAPAVDRSYRDLMPELDSEEMSKLLIVVDPINYLKYLDIPKYIVSASADDFFLPDSSQFYFDKLPQNKWQRVLPNESHYIVRNNAPLITRTLLSVYGAHIDDRKLPDIQWDKTGGTVQVSTEQRPLRAVLWKGRNAERRDFRTTRDNPGVKKFTPEEITLSCSMVCEFKLDMEKPESGWNAYFIEIYYANKKLPDLVLTTPVFIYPETYPDAAAKRAMHK